MFRQFFVLISSALSATIIPIHFNEHNRPVVSNITIAGVEDSNATVTVMVTLQSKSYSAIRSVQGGRAIATERGFIVGDNLEITHGMIHGYLRFHYSSHDLIHMGIGRGSLYLDRYNSVSFLRNDATRTGSLILGDAEAGHFNRSCMPDSVISIPYNTPLALVRIRSLPYVAAQTRLIFPSRHEVVDTRHNMTEVACEPRKPSPKIVSLSPALVDEILRILTTSGAVQDALRPWIFSNCIRRSLIDQLPQIRLSFTHTGFELIFFPEDYVQFNPETNVCELNFSRSTDETMPLKFNPLALPNMNLHITNDEIRICDAL